MKISWICNKIHCLVPYFYFRWIIFKPWFQTIKTCFLKLYDCHIVITRDLWFKWGYSDQFYHWLCGWAIHGQCYLEVFSTSYDDGELVDLRGKKYVAKQKTDLSIMESMSISPSPNTRKAAWVTDSFTFIISVFL